MVQPLWSESVCEKETERERQGNKMQNKREGKEKGGKVQRIGLGGVHWQVEAFPSDCKASSWWTTRSLIQTNRLCHLFGRLTDGKEDVHIRRTSILIDNKVDNKGCPKQLQSDTDAKVGQWDGHVWKRRELVHPFRWRQLPVLHFFFLLRRQRGVNVVTEPFVKVYR